MPRGEMIYENDLNGYAFWLLDPKECGKTLEQQAKERAAVTPGVSKIVDCHGAVLWLKD